MVGIPGRSKGCITCKKRKVKCDETRPKCNRCLNAYMICDGYAVQRGNVFVHESSRFQWPLISTEIRQRRPPTIATSNIASTKSDRLGRSEALPRSPRPPKTLSLRAYQQNICISFTTQRLFRGSGSELPPSGGDRSWVFEAIELDQTRTVYYAACCMSSAFFARMHSDSECLRTAAVFYGQALSHLNNNLRDDSRCWHPANVAAAILLLLYELSVFSNSAAGWLQHAGGLERLIEMRGADSFQQWPANNYFRMSQLPIISRALALRKRTFLAGDAWEYTSYAEPGQPKEYHHSAMHVVAAIPELLEDSDRMQAARRKASTLVSDDDLDAFRSRLVRVMCRLFLWRWEWEGDFPYGAYEVAVDPNKSMSVDHHGKPLFTTLLFYADFHICCRAITLYNTGILLLLELVQTWNLRGVPASALALALAQRDPPPRNTPLQMPCADLSIQDVAQEICRSVEYHLQGPHTSSGAVMLGLPLRVIGRLSASEREKAWLARTVRSIARANGFQTCSG